MNPQNPAPHPIAAVLFDLDGTILDSEPNYYASDKALLESFGIHYDEALNTAMTGRGTIEFFKELVRLFPGNALHDLPLAERVLLKDKSYLDYARGRTHPFAGVVDYIRELAARGVPMAIASGSSPDVIRETLGFAGLLEFFPVRVSASEVPRGKPEPDVFLEAARRLGVAPGACLVLEDSRHGVVAAKRAGMACIGLPHPDHHKLEGFEQADLLVSGGAACFHKDLALSAWAYKAASR